ncbi:MAG: hypothetical protein L6Q71_00850, partial [Planctomycetes bacterium]|nr:hypothetical protein [Planctomycetota bacterium]
MAVPGRALFGLIVVWALALPCALRAQYDIDDIETIPVARKLAIDFRLYDDAIEMLESIKDKSKRDIAIASIYKIQGDHCAESDSTKATEYYSKALALIKDATDEAVRIEYVRMLIDVASSGTQSTDKSKKDLDDAKKIADEVWQSITTRTKPMDWAENADGTPSTLYMLLMNTYYERARACYRLALLEPEGSQKRNEWLKLTDEIIRKMMFDRIADGVEALFRVHLLAGDVALARPDPQLAVERYLELPEFMKAFSQAHPMVREMSLLGYINAVETLLNRMGDAPEAIHEALGIIEKALREFPIALKETRGKTLRMYGVSARIKIGEGRLADALKELFELAKDPDKEFQVKASLQLARIAKGSGLPNADRLRCARQALEVNTFDLVMEANQVIHAILANIGSPEDFEAYAPLCYVLLANSAENTRRYFDEAVICMEAADRLSFFRKKYTEGSAEKLPPHFFDGSGKAICSGASLSAPIDLKTHADAFELPREFARRAKAAAGWLLQSQFGGDKDNAKFKSFEQEIEVWFRKYEKEDDRYKAITSAGYDMFNKKDWVGAAQHLLSTLKGGSAMQANYFAGVAFANAYTGAGTVSAGPIDREKFWLDGYQLLDLPFEAQSARIDPEFPNVTPNLRDELRAALDAFMDPKRSVDRRLDTRGMAIFALKRTLLIKIDERANEITESGFDMASSNIAGALTAMSKLANAQFLNQPEDKRSADPTMLLLGRAVNQLAYCYRYPRLDTTGSAADAQIAEIKKQDLREALDYLLMSGDAFDPHFNAEIARGATPQAQANAMDVKRSTMKMKFDACVEAGIAKDAQRTFIDYRGLFEKAGDDAARQKTRKELAAMASKLGEALREAGGLYWSAQMYAGTKLDYL